MVSTLCREYGWIKRHGKIVSGLQSKRSQKKTNLHVLNFAVICNLSRHGVCIQFPCYIFSFLEVLHETQPWKPAMIPETGNKKQKVKQKRNKKWTLRVWEIETWPLQPYIMDRKLIGVLIESQDRNGNRTNRSLHQVSGYIGCTHRTGFLQNRYQVWGVVIYQNHPELANGLIQTTNRTIWAIRMTIRAVQLTIPAVLNHHLPEQFSGHNS